MMVMHPHHASMTGWVARTCHKLTKPLLSTWGSRGNVPAAFPLSFWFLLVPKPEPSLIQLTRSPPAMFLSLFFTLALLTF